MSDDTAAMLERMTHYAECVMKSFENGRGYLDMTGFLSLIPEARRVLASRTLDAVVTICGRAASDYMTTDDVAEGHYTVVSFLARFDPEAIALMGPLDEATQRDGFWLSREAKRQGLRCSKVMAPKVLQDRGIDRVNVYPEALLRRRFGL